MLLREIALAVLTTHTPMGQTVLSVEQMPECGLHPDNPTCTIAPVCEPATSPLCQAPRWSDSHDAWVRVERAETARIRYASISVALEESVRTLLCLQPNGKRIPTVKDENGEIVSQCKPIQWAYVHGAKRNLGTPKELLLSGMASLILESGAREDVQVGRGRYKKPDSVNGMGRGPGNEACLLQVMPHMVYRFADWITDEEREKAQDSKSEREKIAQQLLGRDQVSLQRCFRTGLRMLAHSRQVCQRRQDKYAREHKMARSKSDNTAYWWAFGMYSYYGVGPSGNADGCYDFNGGKTLKRVRLLQKLLATTQNVTYGTPPTDDVWTTVKVAPR